MKNNTTTRRRSTTTFATLALGSALVAASAYGCASGEGDGHGPGALGEPALGGAGGDDANIDPGSICGDVSNDAVVDVSAAEHQAFANAPGSAGALVFDPPSGAVLPFDWPSPTFLARTGAMPAAVQLRLTLPNGTELRHTQRPIAAEPSHADSVVGGAWWTIQLPQATWNAARCQATTMSWSLLHLAEGASVPAGVASGTLRLLEGVGDPDMTYLAMEQPATLSTPSSYAIERIAVSSGSAQELVSSDQSHCIGCHTSSPDGLDLIYQELGGPGWQLSVVRPVGDGTALPSPVVSESAAAILATTMLMVPTTTPAAWSDETGRWLGAINADGRVALLELDGEAVAKGPLYLAPALDAALSAATPTLSPDGSRVVFVATDGMGDGYFSSGSVADLWQQPVVITKGAAPLFGDPSPLPHASASTAHETYPSFSTDGSLITFTRTAAGTQGYDEETAEIYVMPADGSAPATRIAANDAPLGEGVYVGAGLTNSWSRFGQSSLTNDEGTWYFVVFSSRRGSGALWEDRALGSNHIPGRPIPRLYISALLRRSDGTIEGYPAVLVPGQRPTTGAHTATFVTVTSVAPPPPLE